VVEEASDRLKTAPNFQNTSFLKDVGSCAVLFVAFVIGHPAGSVFPSAFLVALAAVARLRIEPFRITRGQGIPGPYTQLLSVVRERHASTAFGMGVYSG
jgi:hypothetical protein